MKSNYAEAIKHNSIWQIDFNKIIHKYKKYGEDPQHIEKIHKKTLKLFEAIKKENPQQKKSKDKKKQNGQKKQVQFNDNVQMKEIDSFNGNRTWNDHKKKNLNKGKFSEEEVKMLMNSICQYVQVNNLGEDDLIKLCSKSKEELGEELKGAWCKISESLQDRSVQSCHNFCRRKFNPNNYNGKWTEDEEAMLIELVRDRGHQWKEIANVINGMFDRRDLTDQKFGRTPENIKDKWKHLGGDNIDYRKKGPWTIEEGISLLRSICIANNVQLIKKSKQVHFKFDKEGKILGSKRIKIKDDDIYIYDKFIQLDQIVPLITKKKRCKKVIPTLEISWTAIQTAIKTRSVDDIRNYWNLKLLPLLVPSLANLEWEQDDDIDLLNEIIEMDVTDTIDLDFEQIGENLDKNSDNCQRRWEILLKGLGGIPPGKRINVKMIAKQLIHDIKTKQERYVPWISNKNSSRNGTNQYINIVEYYRKHFLGKQ
ncbi:myb-like dna-binding domain containing protein [Stylonychia lemnae]|uniref:Myb-like dna-binding domain containing protein n=1 Tax=Stylonychia lemnae TaxID=5949 RepID=A0A078A4E9_STYLE|nr:myb-like dna-binding domain containing protein [Stylonychia lemnae]|eukprot:CDW77042.1 myb-like dna-binding domain containing protein [Stylonychia lemnae]